MKLLTDQTDQLTIDIEGAARNQQLFFNKTAGRLEVDARVAGLPNGWWPTYVIARSEQTLLVFKLAAVEDGNRIYDIDPDSRQSFNGVDESYARQLEFVLYA